MESLFFEGGIYAFPSENVQNYLHSDILVKTDRASMATSLEVRAPFLDNSLIDLIQKIPSNIRTKKRDFKYLLRNSVKEVLPKKNLYNRKRGFVGLESQSIEHNFDFIINEIFNKEKVLKQGLFNFETLNRFLLSFKKIGKYREITNLGYLKNYNYKSLWGLIMFQRKLQVELIREMLFKLLFLVESIIICLQTLSRLTLSSLLLDLVWVWGQKRGSILIQMRHPFLSLMPIIF